MSKYILGQAHQGNPVIASHKLDDATDLSSALVGYAIAINSDGKVEVADGSLQLLGVGVAKGNYVATSDNLSVLKSGEKVLVKTNGTAVIGSPVYVTAAGLFTSLAKTGEVDNQAFKGLFVGQDDESAAETLPTSTALVDLI